MAEILEYELIDITFGYELPDDNDGYVHEDGMSQDEPAFEYDAYGIPMGNTIKEIELRETIIINFLEKWG